MGRRGWLLLLAVIPLLSCNDTGGGVDYPGPTPFVRLVPVNSLPVAQVTRYRYVIAPKPTAVSAPVDVTYSAAALARGGYLGTDSATIPVFGLYAGYDNQVTFHFTLQDGSTRDQTVEVTTPQYSDPDSVYDHPRVLQPRSAGSIVFNYFYLKSQTAGPVVIDTDGEIRWVGPNRIDAFSSTFRDGGFLVGSPPGTLKPLFTPGGLALHRLELDGTEKAIPVVSATYTDFHHNFDKGKIGILADMDDLQAGTLNLESTLSEVSPTGEILTGWNLAELIATYMRNNGDDPASFVRPGVDWFHLNAAVYDPRDDSVVVSSRENFVMKIAYATGEIAWILGDPTKYWYTFPSLRAKALQLEMGSLYPIGQHGVSITSDGLLLLFNDGFASLHQPAGQPAGESRTYSAVSAYSINQAAMTAREEWRFDYGQSILAKLCSSAYQARDGSILVDYATAENFTKARLVGLDAARMVVFDFEYPSPQPCATAWNAEPVPFESLVIQ